MTAYLQKIAYLFLFIILVSFLCYFFTLRFKPEINYAIESHSVIFNVSRDKIKAVRLNNGMKVVAFQNNLKPKVLMRLCYDVGSSVEQSDEQGFAHLIEHMIFKGTDKLSEIDIDAITKKYGADANAATSYDDTSYYFETDNQNWRPFLDLLADCMQNPTFDEQAFASELKAVVAELDLGSDHLSERMRFKALELLFPPNHPYHFPIIGFREGLAKATSEDLRKFYYSHYHLERAVLFIIGDVSLDEMIDAAKTSFDNIVSCENKSTEITRPALPVVFPTLDDINFNIYEDIKTEQLCFFWLLPHGWAAKRATVEIAEDILAGDSNSVLYRRLVDKEMVAKNVTSSILFLKQARVLYICIKPKLGLALKCEEILKDELKTLVDNGVTKKAVSRRVPIKIKEFIEGLGDFQDTSYSWMKFYFEQNKVFEYFNFIDELYSVSAEGISEFFKDVFAAGALKKIHLLPLLEGQRQRLEKNKKIILDQEQDILQNHVRSKPIAAPRFAANMPEAKISNFKIPKATKLVSVNNTKIIFYYDDKQPITNFVLRFKNPDYNQYALTQDISLMMDLLLEGSIGVTKQNHLDFFESMGASCDFDETGITCSCLETNFLPVLERIFYILKKPVFSKDALERAREIHKGNIMSAQQHPESLAKQCFLRMIFKGTIFDYGFEEMLSCVQNLTLQDISAAHKNLNPRDFVMGVSGKFNQTEVSDVLTKLTQDYDVLPQVASKVIPTPKTQFLTDVDLELLRDQTYLFWSMPLNVAITDDAYSCLALASYVVVSGFASRMFNIRESSGLFYSYGGNLVADVGLTFCNSYVDVYLSPNSLLEGEKTIKKMFQELLRRGVTEGEVIGAKRNYLNTLLDSYSSSFEILQTSLWYLSRDLSVELPERIWDSIKNMNVTQVNNALRKYLDLSKVCRISVGDCSNTIKPLRSSVMLDDKATYSAKIF